MRSLLDRELSSRETTVLVQYSTLPVSDTYSANHAMDCTEYSYSTLAGTEHTVEHRNCTTCTVLVTATVKAITEVSCVLYNVCCTEL
jgi:hypothetical protein